MNILEFRHFEPNLKKLIQAGAHKKIAIERIEHQPQPDLEARLEEEAKLGKRDQARPIEEIMAEFKNIDSIKEFISERKKLDREEELHYMRDYRIKTELWKKFMVRRNPSKVSFVVHNIDFVADRVLQVIPNNRPQPTRTLTSMLMQNTNNELEKEDARLRLSDSGWSLEELADFGIENILNVSGTQLYIKLMETRFPHKTLGEVIELYELLKSPFNFKYNKAEYKRIPTEQEKKEFLDEIRFEIMVYLIDLLYTHLLYDQRISCYTSGRRLRITINELRGLLRA